jgi:long-chain acyl-CoA synthetase
MTMPHGSLLEYFQRDSRPSGEIALVWRRGYRTIRWRYGDLFSGATQFAWQLQTRGIKKGDRVLLWAENSGEWVAAFLGCMLSGAVCVPMDLSADRAFAERVADVAAIRLGVLGKGVAPLANASQILRLEDFFDSAKAPGAETFSPPVIAGSDPVQIVFTSGTTAEPRGVLLTHSNILANLQPIESEIGRYRRYERIFHPLKILNLLPLSHVFGQLLGIFIPQILGATAIFLDTLNPSEVVRAIKGERVSVLVTVPRLLESLRDQVERDLTLHGRFEKFQRDSRSAQGEHLLKRWWRFRSIRRRFGWRFLAVVCGGAALPAAVEEFWKRLGYAVIQGYGLTETTALVSLNHPFRLGSGSIGKAMPGLELKLSEDGEILVRGPNVAQSYWQHEDVVSIPDSDGWFHTGDLGERDQVGNLYFKGRRKNVIVMPEGLNVYPQDLEAELRKEPLVRDCVVVGLEQDGNAQPCAVLLLKDSGSEPGIAATIVQHANDRLAPFQRMHHWLVWLDKDFPRTSTQKPVLSRIREAVEAELNGRQHDSAPAKASGALSGLLKRVLPGTLPPDQAAPLDLSSIDRVELLSAIEDRYQVDLSEAEFNAADTLQDLERLVGQPSQGSASFKYPRWPQSWGVRLLRAAVFTILVRPAMLILGWPRVIGRDSLRGSRGPVLVVSNHVTYFDPVYILHALPQHLRQRLAVAMDGERLESMRNPSPESGFFSSLLSRAKYLALVALFNVFPLPRRAGFRRSFAFTGDLVDRGWSVLIFPEGELTRGGRMAPFRGGIGLLATDLGVPVVPARLDGLFQLKRAEKKWARPGQIKVSLGAAIPIDKARSAEEVTRELENQVAALAGASGE